MSDDFLGDRRKALENEFFTKQNQELLEQLQAERKAEERRAALAQASGISDEAVLDEIARLELGPETLAALSLVPLVAVAWADGQCEDRERSAVLQAAEQSGLRSGDPAYRLLESWLDARPGQELLEAWKDYVGALGRNLGDRALDALKSDLLERARHVAEAAGGFLGLGNRVSKDEQVVLDELDRAFPS